MKFFYSIALLIASHFSILGQSFSVEVSSDTIFIGNYIEITFHIDNIEGEFEMPHLEGFEVIGGPNVSSSMQILNGRMTSKKSYSYYIQPHATGTFVIDPAGLLTHEKKWQTEEIKIEVVPNPDNLIIIPESNNSIFKNPPSLPYQDFNKPEEKPVKEKKLKRL